MCLTDKLILWDAREADVEKVRGSDCLFYSGGNAVLQRLRRGGFNFDIIKVEGA